MICACSNCGTKFNIPDKKIPERGAKFRCSKCKTVFKVEKNKKDPGSTPVPKKTEIQQKKRGKTQIQQEIPATPKVPSIPPPIPQIRNKPGEKVVVEEIPEEDSSAYPHEECKRGAPAWIMTFADLATLMLTFFVLLLSFANMDVVKFKEMLGSVQDAFGVTKKIKGQFQATLKGKETDELRSKGGDSKIIDSKAKQELQRQQVTREIEKTADQLGEGKNISVTVGEHGVKVRIKGAYFFNPGSAVLKKEARPFLDNISIIMKKFPFQLKVEGHTDDIPISTREFPSNWELSAVRATSVLRYFVELKGIDSKRLTAIGYAENKPIASNDSPAGRAKNRRVEFIFSKK